MSYKKYSRLLIFSLLLLSSSPIFGTSTTPEFFAAIINAKEREVAELETYIQDPLRTAYNLFIIRVCIEKIFRKKESHRIALGTLSCGMGLGSCLVPKLLLKASDDPLPTHHMSWQDRLKNAERKILILKYGRILGIGIGALAGVAVLGVLDVSLYKMTQLLGKNNASIRPKE